MQVREGYKNALARLMPLEPFPLYAPSGSASPANPSPLGQSIGPLQQEIGLQSPPRLASASMPTRGRSTMSMDRLPSAPFSRFAAPSLCFQRTRHNSPNSNASLNALSPAFGVSEVPCPRRVSPTIPLLRDAPFPQARQGNPLPPVLSFEGPALPHRSPVPSLSSVRSPPPPYTSNPASPAPSFDAGFGESAPGVGPPGRAYGLGIQRPIVSDPPPFLHGQNVERLPGTGHTLPLPPRLRGLHVNEDLERQQLNRLREEYHAGKRLSSLTDNGAELRNMNVRRLEQHEAALASRRMRELERSNFLRQLSRKKQDLYPPLGHQVDGSEADSLRKAEDLGALRAREIQAKLVAHRRALRNIQEERRDRKLEEIERLAGRSARSGLNPNAEEFRLGNAGYPTDVSLRDRRYSTPLY